jgi:hypothetical protein
LFGEEEQWCSMAAPMELSPGESIIYKEDLVVNLISTPILPGSLIITNFQLIYTPNDPSYNEVASFAEPLLDVQRITLHPLNRSVYRSIPDVLTHAIELKCKRLRTLYFATRNEAKFVDLLCFYIFPENIEQAFAFRYKPKFAEEANNGWNVHNTEREFQRQGILNPCSSWRITTVNEDYSLCSSYPPTLVVPKQITDEELTKAAAFRSRGRIPVLSYKHYSNQATVTRSSQPMVGLTMARSPFDEKLVEAVRENNPMFQLNTNQKLCIIDARPQINAMGNAAKGAGTEGSRFYKNCEVIFLGIGNIKVMSESLLKLRYLCEQTGDIQQQQQQQQQYQRWLSSLEETEWLSHVSAVLTGAVTIAKLVDSKGISVLCHCSDGWDRTSQLVSLAQLMLDPYFRTLEGFEVLIEKDWCEFGHRFNERAGHATKKPSDQRSPIFLQWIDCVWQLTQQFPTCFEFNERLLITVVDSLYNCQYGTFLCNSRQEKEELQVPQKTLSLWTYVNCHSSMFQNACYAKDATNKVIIPCTSVARLQLWTSYYLRFNTNFHPVLSDTLKSLYCTKEELWQREHQVSQLQQSNLKLLDEIELLRKQVAELTSKGLEIANGSTS